MFGNLIFAAVFLVITLRSVYLWRKNREKGYILGILLNFLGFSICVENFLVYFLHAPLSIRIFSDKFLLISMPIIVIASFVGLTKIAKEKRDSLDK